MELSEYHIKPSTRAGTIDIIPLGDTHIGNKSFDRDAFGEAVATIKREPNTYWVGLGDACEFITISDPRFDAECLQGKMEDLMDLPFHQAQEYISLVKPIAHKCIGLHWGNHEDVIKKHYYYDIHERICQELRVRNLGWSSLTRLIFRRGRGIDHSAGRVLIMYSGHGVVAGRKKGSKINRLEDRMGDFMDVDIFLTGHSHDKVASTRHLLYLSKTGKLELKEKQVVFGICPSFFNTYEEKITTYGERREYSPTSKGILRIRIKPFVRKYRTGHGKRTGSHLETYEMTIIQ